MRTRLRLAYVEAWTLLALYAGFVVWMSLATTGVAAILPGGSP